MAFTYLLKNIPAQQSLIELSKLYSDLDVNATQSYLLLLQTASSILSMTALQTARRGTSPGRLSILIQLRLHAKEGLSPWKLAEAVGATRAAITGLVDGLESSGFIERRADPVDRRSIKIRLTLAGRKFLDSIMPERCRRISALMSGLNENERKTLSRLLKKISAGFKAFSSP